MTEEMLAPYQEMWSRVFSIYANRFQISLEQYTAYFYNSDSGSLIKEYAENSLKQDLMLQAVANKEGLKISDEELEQKLLEDAGAAGYATVEEYVGEGSKEDYRNDYMNERVLEYLQEKTTVKEAGQ